MLGIKTAQTGLAIVIPLPRSIPAPTPHAVTVIEAGMGNTIRVVSAGQILGNVAVTLRNIFGTYRGDGPLYKYIADCMAVGESRVPLPQAVTDRYVPAATSTSPGPANPANGSNTAVFGPEAGAPPLYNSADAPPPRATLWYWKRPVYN